MQDIHQIMHETIVLCALMELVRMHVLTYLRVADSKSGGACASCPPGSFSAGGAANNCTLCPEGMYADHYAANQCDQCPPGALSEKQQI